MNNKNILYFHSWFNCVHLLKPKGAKCFLFIALLTTKGQSLARFVPIDFTTR